MAKNRAGQVQWQQLKVPTVDELKYVLDQYISMGVLTPEDVEIFEQDPSTLEAFLENPEVVTSQLQSLKNMETLGEGKLTEVDKANMVQQMQMEAQQERATRDAILSNARSRGVAGSGLEFAAQLQSQQDAANRSSRVGTDVSVAAQQRGLEALAQAGQMAGNIRSQELDVAARKAAAQDAINQFNTANRQDITKLNVDARNDAQRQNLAEQQRIAEANVNQTNTQREIAANAAQQAFQNNLQKTGGLANAIAENYRIRDGADANRKAEQGSNLQTAATVVASMFSDKNCKKDIKEFDPSEFLDSIVPVKYKYKDEMAEYGENPNTEHKGVIAQDVEKGAPEIVKEIDGIKSIDIKGSVPLIMAALADVHKRLKNVEKK